MGIFDIFRNVQAVTPTQVAPAPGTPPSSIQVAAPVPPMSQVNPGADPQNQSINQPGQPNANPAQPPNPLDNLAALWKTDPTATPPADPLAAPLFNTDPAKIKQTASQVDFLKMVPQDVMTKVMAGNDPGAIATLVNAVAQQTLAAAAQLNAATVEQAAQRNNQRMLQVLPGQIRNVQVSQASAENPALNHPAAQPFVSLIRQTLAARDPSLTPQQVNQKAEAAMMGLAEAIMAPTTQQANQQKQQAEAGTNWDAWAGITQ